ncbi:hypothetical protein ACFX43_09175 [Nocardioides sp. YIM B13467]|uniref:hypothetical protein n=1 Tax=Nocardioides sp. YIM B13467 TaxID=3366294 RepID=UPI00366FAFED
MPDWVVAVLPVASALATLVIGNWHSRKLARESRVDAEIQAAAARRFAAREARYTDRRGAVTAFIAAVEDEMTKIQHYVADPNMPPGGPGDLNPEYEFSKLNQAHAELAVIADEPIVGLASTLRYSVVDYFYNGKSDWDNYRATLSEFQRTARAMLSGDAVRAEPAALAREADKFVWRPRFLRRQVGAPTLRDAVGGGSEGDEVA